MTHNEVDAEIDDLLAHGIITDAQYQALSEWYCASSQLAHRGSTRARRSTGKAMVTALVRVIQSSKNWGRLSLDRYRWQQKNHMVPHSETGHIRAALA